MVIELRPWQRDVIDKVPERLAPSENIAIDAPTGSGKTVMALWLARKLGAGLVLVAVRTRNEEVRFWEDVGKVGLPHYPFALIGKASLCRLVRNANLKSLISDEENIDCQGCRLRMDNNKSLIERLIRDPTLLETVASQYTGINPNYPTDVFEQEVGKLSIGDVSLGRYCTYNVMKTLAVLTARKAPLLVVGAYPHIFTTPYLYLNILNSYLEGEDRRGRFLVIIDEAHNIDNLPDDVERRVTASRLERVINAGFNLCRRVEEQARKAGVKVTLPSACSLDNNKLKEYTSIIEQFGKELEGLVKKYGVGEGMHKRVRVDDVYKLLNTMSGLLPLVKDFAELEAKYSRSRFFSGFIRTYILMRSMAMYLAGEQNPFTEEDLSALVDPSVWRFYVTANSRPALVLKPITPKPIVLRARRLFNDTWVLMSGTLPDRKYIENVWGLEVDYYFSVNVKLGERVVRVDTDVTSRFDERNEEMFNKYADKIRGIVSNNDGSVYLVVYPSYDFMKQVVKRLADLPVMQVSEDSEKSLARVREIAKTAKKLVIHAVANGRFTEGIEIVEDGVSKINHVIMAGMPFPNVKDDFIQDRIKASGLTPVKFLLTHARMITLQATGRAIRSNNDKATIWLLDSRYPGYAKNWGLIT
jgi:DNA excision repair protein ERCC-2